MNNKTNLSTDALKVMFATLMTAGCRPPSNWDSVGIKAAVNIWHTILSDLTDDDLTSAVVAYLRTGDAQWWPTPGRLLQLVPSRRAEAVDDSDEAWGLALQLASRHGRDQRPVQYHEDKAKHRRIEAGIKAVGGWRVLCNSRDTDHAANRAAFRSAYRSCKQRTEIHRENNTITNVVPLAKLIGGTK